MLLLHIPRPCAIAIHSDYKAQKLIYACCWIHRESLVPLVKNMKHLDAMEEVELRRDDSGRGDEGRGRVGGTVTSTSSFTGEATSTTRTKHWSMTSHARVEGAGVAAGGNGLSW